MSRAEVNAFDRAGFWRLADITLSRLRRAHPRRRDLRGAVFRRLGFWSDGRAVKPPIIGNNPTTVPRVFPTNGLRVFKWLPLDLLVSEPEADSKPVPEPKSPSPIAR